MPRLTLLLPTRDRLRDQPLPVELGKLLARADRSAGDAGGKPQLQRHFDVIPRHCSVAPITRHLDAPGAEQQAWLRADPAWVQADINGGRMLACGDMGLSLDDAQALIAPLRTLFGDEGFPISAPTPSRWYLMLPREAKFPAFAAPEDVLGDDLVEHLPQGDAGRRWRRLLNEAQVILHNHPLNELRMAKGQPPVNSLWFWGGGVLPDFVRIEGRVFADDIVLRALADLAKSPLQPAPARYESALREAPALVDLRGSRELATLARDWIAPAAASLRRDDELRLDFADGALFTIRRGQRWRFWRRALAQLASPE
ncbi:MAG: phosphoglycerate mutase [Proteobacteria bacterium]|nr:phosphoglycerate mutase [Pseudomonadota bacterium]